MAEIALRWSGWLLVAGAALLGAAIVRLSFKPVINQQFSQGISILFLASSILLLLALPAMYARQANTAGWLGLTGFVLLQTGVLLISLLASPTLLYPSVKTPVGESVTAFLLGIALTVGLLLTGVATLQAGVFPRWSGILLLTATAGFFFSFFVAEWLRPIAGQLGSACFGIILAAALAWVGFSMWTNPSAYQG